MTAGYGYSCYMYMYTHAYTIQRYCAYSRHALEGSQEIDPSALCRPKVRSAPGSEVSAFSSSLAARPPMRDGQRTIESSHARAAATARPQGVGRRLLAIQARVAMRQHGWWHPLALQSRPWVRSERVFKLSGGATIDGQRTIESSHARAAVTATRQGVGGRIGARGPLDPCARAGGIRRHGVTRCEREPGYCDDCERTRGEGEIARPAWGG